MAKEALKSIAKCFIPDKFMLFIGKLYGTTITKLAVKSLLANKPVIRLEIGSGPKKGTKEWVTLDMSFDSDIYWDLRNKLPFPDNSISSIYSSHVLEHFSYKELNILLRDCLRILKPGGVFSACIPDAGIYIKSYFNRDNLHDIPMEYEPALYSNLDIDKINYIAYMDGHHKYMFDKENILFMLRKVGFESASLRDFDPSVDMPDREKGSIYVICSKRENK